MYTPKLIKNNAFWQYNFEKQIIAKRRNDIQMLSEVIQSYEIPTTIVAKVCWKSAETIKFISTMANIRTPKVIKFLNEDNESKNTPDMHDIYIVDMNCVNSQSFLTRANINQMFRKPYRWLILDTGINNNLSIASEFADLDITVDSEVLIVKRKGNNEYEILSIYKIEPKSTWNIEHFGSWSSIQGLKKSRGYHGSSTAMRRKNLNGLKVVISAVINDNKTKTELENLSHISIDIEVKCTVRIISPLFLFANATKHVIFTDKWGVNINGTWSGMIGDLDRGAAELGGLVTFITKERLEALEYLTHPTPLKLTFVFRSPPLSYENNLFLLPFKPVVWYCTISFAIILILILYVNAKWEMKKNNKLYLELDDPSILAPDISDVSVLVFSAISQQGCSKEIKSALGRFIIFILYLTFLFLYTSYSANIVALLQSTSNQIKTLKDLLMSKMEVGVEDVVYNRYYFTRVTDPVRKAIYETKMLTKGPKQNFMSMEEGVKKLQTEPFAFHMNAAIGYKIVEKYFHEHEKCGLQEIDYLQMGKPWLCCRKNTPFKEIYKLGFYRIQEHGLSNRENNLVYSKKPVCTARGGTFVSVNMVDFHPVLLMLTYGAIAAVFILITEMLVNRRMSSKITSK